MTILSQIVQDERTARMVLSMLVEPDDAVTGRLLGELGAQELFRIAEGDDAVPGLSTVDAQVWRAQFQRPDTRTLEENLVEAERAGTGTQAVTVEHLGCRERRPQTDHHARHAAVTDQRVRSGAEHMDGDILRRFREKVRQVGLVRRQEEHIRRTAHTQPGDVLQRSAFDILAANGREAVEKAHPNASSSPGSA